MNIFKSLHNPLKKTLLLSALALPFAASLTSIAQAAPPRYAPVRGPRANRFRNDRRYRVVRTFTGRVTNVRSGQSFDIRVGNTNYNVYTETRLPRRLNQDDLVQVSGVRSGDNDIRQATVVVVRNR